MSVWSGRFGGRDADPLVDTFVYWTDGRRQALGESTAERYEFRRGRPAAPARGPVVTPLVSGVGW